VAAVVPLLSFCATNLNTRDRLEASLDSIAALGAAVEGSYEIVVAEGPSDDGASAWLATESGRNPRLRVVAHDRRNRGYGRRRAFEASRGRWIVPFDTSLVYGPEYGRLLARFVHFGSSKMLFTEICALSRATVEAVGGWRDLVGGEDVDLYSRVIAKFGVVAYPTGAPASQSATLGSYSRQMRYVQGGRLARARRIYQVQRDQVIASHSTVADLMAFNRKKPLAARIARRAFFTFAAVGARFSTLRPVELGTNNYLIVREGLFASLLAGDWRTLEPGGAPPRLLLTDDEFAFLEVRSPFYRTHHEELAPFLGRK
jgi:glycosyltransferase involved in cell wall biosynthesis